MRSGSEAKVAPLSGVLEGFVGVEMAEKSVSAPVEKVKIGRDVVLGPLDGMRALCALSIVVGHWLTFYGPTLEESDSPPFVPYITAVTMFFLISGYLLTILYGDKFRAEKGSVCSCSPRRRSFWCKRIARIVPLYLVGVGLAVVVTVWYLQTDYAASTGMNSVSSAVSAAVGVAFFLQTWTFQGTGLDGPLWQVSAFMWSYLLFPMVIKSVHARRQSTFLRVVLIVIPASAMLAAIPFNVTTLVHIHFLARFPQFVLGMMLALDVQDGRSPRLSLNALTAVLAVGWVALFVPSFFVKNFTLFILAEEGVVELWSVPLLMGYVRHLTLPSNQGSVVCRFLSSRPMAWLGKLSFAVYCVHYPIIRLFTCAVHGGPVAYVVRSNIPGTFGLTYWELPVLLAIIVVAAFLLNRLVEEPLRTLIVGWAVDDSRKAQEARPILESQSAEP